MARRILGLPLAAAVVLAGSLLLPGAAVAHDHPATTLSANVPPGPAVNAGGTNASWERLYTFGTGNPHTDLDFFTKNGEIYMAVGTLAIGPNSGGQTIIKLTQGGQVTTSPPSMQLVANHPSASCISSPAAATGLQHDVEATPKGNVLFNTTSPFADTRDAQLILDATDQRGRCHDSALLGASDPRGGLEIVDITDVTAPKEIGLTSHIGESHTVNVDPKRPHIAYAVTSDFAALPTRSDSQPTVGCNADDTACNRADEDADASTNQGLALDGFEIVDLRSCLDFPSMTSLEAKRLTCGNGIKVYRYRWPSALSNMGHSVDVIAGCHELEVYPNDLLTCAGVQSTMLFDMKGVFNDNGTPTNYRDDTVNGTPLPCRVRPSVSLNPGPHPTGALVTDCVDTDAATAGNEMTIEGWKARGAPSVAGVVHVGTAFHQGRPPNNEPAPYDAHVDVQISHEAELTHSGKFILATDERGGGVAPPGATCEIAGANVKGNGGVHAYSVDRLLTVSPPGVDPSYLLPPPDPAPAQAQAAWTSYAQKPGGGKAIHRVPVRTPVEPNVCTSHVFHQIPGQNRIFMGWYSQGTQVLDYVERPDGTFEFREVGWFIPELASTWTSAIFKYENNGNGTFTYWGATGDFNLGTSGRNAVDIYKVTLPAPPAGPTAVSVLRFSADRAGRSVVLRWRTAQERALLGFNVYRTALGRTIKLNRALIPAKAAGRVGAIEYRFVDRRAKPGAPTRYRLQAVMRDGTRSWIGLAVPPRARG